MKQIVLKVNHLRKDSLNYIADYLGTLGIKPEDVNSFIKCPRNEDEADPELLDNMIHAVDTAFAALEAKKSVFVQVD